jgi:hypothetical protein
MGPSRFRTTANQRAFAIGARELLTFAEQMSVFIGAKLNLLMRKAYMLKYPIYQQLDSGIEYITTASRGPWVISDTSIMQKCRYSIAL